jgi:hypothetical protein
MIKGINSSGRYITVTGGQVPSTYVNNYSGGQGVGNVRYNTATQNMEVYDGNNWMMLNTGFATVELTPETEALLEWSRRKRADEERMKELAKQHPGLQEALDIANKANEQLQIMTALVQT